MNIFDFLLNSYKEAPFLIQIALVIVVIMIITIIVLIISLKSIRSLLNIKDAEIRKHKSEYEALIIEFLYSGDEKQEISDKQRSIINEIKDDIQSVSKRKSVITILSNLMNEVSGEMSESITYLYREIGLMEYAYTRLESKRWHIVAKAIVELRRFRILEAQDKILDFIDSPNLQIRQEAQLYQVQLFKFEGLSFLDTLETPLSEWQQLLLLEALLSIKHQDISDIEPWLRSSNPSVVLFALKLAKIYNQFEKKDIIVELLSHPNERVKLYTGKVLYVLFGYEAEDLINMGNKSLNETERFNVTISI